MSTAPKRGRGRPAATLAVPWFAVDSLTGRTDFQHYDAAETMDSRDWLLNLEIRALIARTGDAAAARFVRRVPIIRRNEKIGFEFEPIRARLSPDARAIFDGQEPRGGVRALHVDEWYCTIEPRLPASIRDAGRAFVPGRTGVEDVAPAFMGPIDDAMESPLLNRVATINLGLPDDVLLDEFRTYLREQREQLARYADAPFAVALDEVAHRHAPKFATLARLRVLALMDVRAWLRETGTKARPSAIARALDLDPREFRQATEYAALVADDFTLRAWMRSAVRAAQ